MRHLRLTLEQETELKLYLRQRVLELMSDNKERIEADKVSDETYNNQKAARAKAGTVFAESNMPFPLTSTVVDHFATGTEEDVFGRKPFCEFKPWGPGDVDLARGLNRWLSYKLFAQGNAEGSILDATHSMFRHRATVLKAVYDEKKNVWEEYDVPILHDAADNDEPVLILGHGNVVEGRDKWMEVPDPLAPPPAPVEQPDPNAAPEDPNADPAAAGPQAIGQEPGVPGQPATPAPTLLVLEKDPTLVFNAQRHYYAPSPLPIKFQDMEYAGAKSLEVDSDCIYVPSEARSLDDANIIVERYDKPIYWVRERYNERAWSKWADMQNKLETQGTGRKTDDKRKKMAKGETKQMDRKNAILGIHEIWLERDVLGWGQAQRIVVWIETSTGELIDYEYQKLVTPHGGHPYSAIAIAKNENMWWGYSLCEMVKPFQDYIDLQWNRMSFRNSINSNPIIAQNPEAIREQKSFYDLRPFDVVTLEQGKTAKDWVETIVFPNTDTNTAELIDRVEGAVKFWLGISDIARGDYSDTPQNTTLGGQEATLKEAGKLSTRWTRRVTMGTENHVEKLVGIAVVTADDQEVYAFMESDVEQSAIFNVAAVRDVRINVKIVVGEETTQQQLQQQQMTLVTVKEYFMYPPEYQMVIRPVMKKILFLLGHDDVDSLLPVPQMPMIDPLTGMTVMVPVPPGTPVPPMQAPATDAQVPPGEEGGGEDTSKKSEEAA